MDHSTPPRQVEWPSILACPDCHFGGDVLGAEADCVGEWGALSCGRCGRCFTVAEAADEMFVQGTAEGIARWAGKTALTYQLRCPYGGSRLIDIRDRLTNVSFVRRATRGSSLGGGISTKYVPQGFVMVSVAPLDDPVVERGGLELWVTVVGSAPGEAPLELWKELMLEARRSTPFSTRLAPIAVVASVDLFLESISEGEVGEGRPGSWSLLLQQAIDRRLADVYEGQFAELEYLVWLRNDLAHGRDYISRLPTDVAEKEAGWLEQRQMFEPDELISPASEFAMRTGLRAIRSIRKCLSPDS